MGTLSFTRPTPGQRAAGKTGDLVPFCILHFADPILHARFALNGAADKRYSFRYIKDIAVEKRFQVFVSSTFKDLEAERQEVMHALLELDCMPAGMELFPAANESQWNLIKKVIDDCDYYI
ncbi:MAG TPA: DUF4062 domain-containing protein, partial [Methylococcaceae bacterium]|nr:DUF4062 domain-containing protein [Methylococcaceae bacterium]